MDIYACNSKYSVLLKAKAVPLHAMKALGGRGDIAYLLVILDLGTRWR
jgi:hypothetical protein